MSHHSILHDVRLQFDPPALVQLTLQFASLLHTSKHHQKPSPTMRTSHWGIALLATTSATLAGCSSAQAASSNATTTPTEDSSIVLAVDDSTCVYKLSKLSCVPAAYCSYQYHFGDTTFDQSCRVVAAEVGRLPQQLHLAYAGAVAGSGMTISWITYTQVSDPKVWIGTSASSLVLSDASVEVSTYYQEGKYSLYSYHATVKALSPFTTYAYKVGSLSLTDFQSQPSSFTTARATDTNDTFEIAVYGDFGVDKNAKETLAYVTEKLLPGKVDFIYHVGDVSYADNAFLSASEFFGFFYEETYNRWMNSLTPVMKQLPYMVLVGNHEAECHSPSCIVSGSKKSQLGNYTAFNARFKMPSAESGGVKNMWYSFEYGPVHFASISSETDYATAPGNSFTGRKYGGFGDQLKWLEADLKKADANRASVPWIVVGMHRAVYTLDQCDANGVPIGEALPVQQGFEELFLKYNVDVVVAGHVHTYERHYPIARNKPVLDGVSADKKTYTNAKAPVYITSGAAGNSEGHQTYKVSDIPWNVLTNIQDYGISKLRVNRTALTWSFVATGTGVQVDEFTMLKKSVCSLVRLAEQQIAGDRAQALVLGKTVEMGLEHVLKVVWGRPHDRLASPHDVHPSQLLVDLALLGDPVALAVGLLDPDLDIVAHDRHRERRTWQEGQRVVARGSSGDQEERAKDNGS